VCVVNADGNASGFSMTGAAEQHSRGT